MVGAKHGCRAAASQLVWVVLVLGVGVRRWVMFCCRWLLMGVWGWGMLLVGGGAGVGISFPCLFLEGCCSCGLKREL